MTPAPSSPSRFPHPLVLLVACIVLAAVLTYVLPAGRFERRDDPATGRVAVVAGTYHRVASTPVGPWGVLLAVQKGIIGAASVIAFVFLVGGAFSVVEQTGALARAVEWLVSRLENRALLAIPVSCVMFSLGGLLFGMEEEVIAFIPMLLPLVHRLGYDRTTAVAMSYGAAVLAGAMSPINPFGVGIAQTIAQVPLLSGAGFRIAVFLPALAMWVWYTARYAARTRVAAVEDPEGVIHQPQPRVAGARSALVLTAVLFAFTILTLGVLRYGWGIDELAALFFAMGIVAGLVGGLGLRGTAEAFQRGFSGMAFAALVIGFARAILVVLEQGQIIDTIVAGLFTPLAKLPVTVAALGMLAAQSLIHFPVPSTSGQAMITLPILVPLSDLLGLSRQVTVLAYQYGAGLLNLLVPTNGALLAMIALAGVPFERWLRFVLKILALLLLWCGIAIVVGVAVGLR